MTRLTLTLAAAALSNGLLAWSAPAIAQSSTGQVDVFVYGTDPCPRSTESQIVVCHHLDEKYRYRLPQDQRLQGTRQERESWAKKSEALTTVGNTGTGSCSAVGPGGFTGCLTQQIKENRKANREQQQSDTAPPQ